MSEKTVCGRCGHAGSVDDHYCARCGRALVPRRSRLANTTDRLLDTSSPRYVSLLSLVALVLISKLVDHLLVKTGLYFASSLVLLALVIGLGSAYLGWQWDMPLSSRNRLMRVLFAFASMGLLLVAVWQIDRALLGSLIGSGRRIVSDIPGVHLEASEGSKRLYISHAPPYWLLVMVYALLVAVVSNLARRTFTALMVREREVHSLRESLVARVHDAAIQQERNRLARELHDSIKQQIFSINMGAAAVQARWDTDPQGAREALDDVRRSAREAMSPSPSTIGTRSTSAGVSASSRMRSARPLEARQAFGASG